MLLSLWSGIAILRMRRTLLLRKIMMLAQKYGELQEKNHQRRGDRIETQMLSSAPTRWTQCFREETGSFNLGVLPLHKHLRSRLRCDACACAPKTLCLGSYFF